MIYGRDVAVEYPIMDLYDTGMMNAYLTAVKNEYERGIKEQEEFVSKYGDFISPFRKDVETWDRLTMDPIVQAYDQMQAAGIDPLRSQEGRALLASIRRRVPRETLNQLRQSAAAGQEYLKNRGELQSKGLYDPAFENFLLNGTSFNDYDTTQSGMWSRTSPTEFKGLRTITDPWFKNRQAKYKYSKNGYDYYGYDENDMRTAVNDQIQAFLGNDYGRYYYNRALQRAQATATPGESLESINKRAYDMLVNDIVDVNHDYLLNDRKENPYAMADYKFRQEVALEGVRHRNRMREQAAAGGDDQPLSTGNWIQTVVADTNKHRGQSDYNRLRSVLVENQRHNQSIANNKNLPKAQRNRAQRMANWYKEAIKNYDNGTAWRTRDRLGNTVPTEAGYKILNAYDVKNRKNRYGAAYDQIEQDYLNNNVTRINGPYSINRSFDYVTNKQTSKLPGVKNSEEYGTVTIGGDTNFRRYRIATNSGAGLSQGSLSRYFNNALRKVQPTAYVKRDYISSGVTPKRSGQGLNIDFYFNGYITEEDMLNVFKRMGETSIKDKTLQRLGISSYTMDGKTMYRIPLARTTTPGLVQSWSDQEDNKNVLGTAAAANNAANVQAADQTLSIQ